MSEPESHRRIGAKITNPQQFHAALNEWERLEKVKAEMTRAFRTGRTVQQLRRDDERRHRRYVMAGIALLMISAFLMIRLMRAVMG